MDLNCVEKVFRDKVGKIGGEKLQLEGWRTYSQIPLISRGVCQSRNMCIGLPYGAYFSSNASTLPWLQDSNMTLRPNSIVHSVITMNKRQAVVYAY